MSPNYHIFVFMHINGPSVVMQLLSLYPDGYGSDITPFCRNFKNMFVVFHVNESGAQSFKLYPDAYDDDKPDHKPNLDTYFVQFHRLTDWTPLNQLADSSK